MVQETDGSGFHNFVIVALGEQVVLVVDHVLVAAGGLEELLVGFGGFFDHDLLVLMESTSLFGLVVFDQVVQVDYAHARREGLFGVGVFEGLVEGVDQTLHIVEAFLDVVDLVLSL